MSMFDTTGAESCRRCGENARAEVERLQAENAKLRELLTDLAVCACGKYCYGCPHQYDGCDRDERLRELIGGEDA